MGKNLLLVEKDRWYSFYFTRKGKEAMFIVQDDTDYFSVTRLASGFALDDKFMMFTSQSMVYLNGFPPGVMVSCCTHFYALPVGSLVIWRRLPTISPMLNFATVISIDRFIELPKSVLYTKFLY